MRKIVRITEQDLTAILKDILSQMTTKDKDKDFKFKPNNTLTTSSKNIVGSAWKSCAAWKSKGGLGKWGDKIKIEKSNSQFKISYKGPSSGVSIAHAANGGDTIHQLYNVLICEMNPFLGQGNMKPNIENIRTEGGKDKKDSTISITVPIERSNETYQIDRRGGWNHDPGQSSMENKCKEVKQKGGKCFGPVKNVLQAPFGKITEYFITHTI